MEEKMLKEQEAKQPLPSNINDDVESAKVIEEKVVEEKPDEEKPVEESKTKSKGIFSRIKGLFGIK